MKALTTVILGLVLAVTAFGAPDSRTETITVKGVATTNVTPDTVFITLFVSDQGMVAEQAVGKVDEKAKVIKAGRSNCELDTTKLEKKLARIQPSMDSLTNKMQKADYETKVPESVRLAEAAKMEALSKEKEGIEHAH